MNRIVTAKTRYNSTCFHT